MNFPRFVIFIEAPSFKINEENFKRIPFPSHWLTSWVMSILSSDFPFHRQHSQIDSTFSKKLQVLITKFASMKLRMFVFSSLAEKANVI